MVRVSCVSRVSHVACAYRGFIFLHFRDSELLVREMAPFVCKIQYFVFISLTVFLCVVLDGIFGCRLLIPLMTAFLMLPDIPETTLQFNSSFDEVSSFVWDPVVA